MDILSGFMENYVDVELTLWLFYTWLLTPLFVTFLLPLVILLLFYTTAVILYVFKLHSRTILDAFEADLWDAARKVVAAVWDAHGWIWHGYEVKGMENIPEDKGALIVYYHGALPVDLYYLISRLYLKKNRLIHTVADRFLFSVPGWGIIAEGLKVIPGTIGTCVSILEEGNLLAISPGGVYEAQLGDSSYRLMWKKRYGFAKVAINAKVAIVPMFTQNLRESFRSVSFWRPIWSRIYSWSRLPIVPIYGGFPVKLVTHIGKPLPFDPDWTPELLQTKVAAAIESLITEHQRVPGSIVRALTERFYIRPKTS